ncbi:interleukin-17D [Rhinolophus sinicus]|uniref:interleukin-17D n=1 Tax=Rhinolophus sinicus TaxID=89399 RepID=UPI003D7AD5D8
MIFWALGEGERRPVTCWGALNQILMCCFEPRHRSREVVLQKPVLSGAHCLRTGQGGRQSAGPCGPRRWGRRQPRAEAPPPPGQPPAQPSARGSAWRTGRRLRGHAVTREYTPWAASSPAPARSWARAAGAVGRPSGARAARGVTGTRSPRRSSLAGTRTLARARRTRAWRGPQRGRAAGHAGAARGAGAGRAGRRAGARVVGAHPPFGSAGLGAGGRRAAGAGAGAGPGGRPRTSRRPARPRGCADRPEELLEQLYGRLAAGVLGAFQHTLQPGPREQARNASCPGGRPDRRFRPPTPLRSVSPWAYRVSYDPARFPRLLPEAYCLCRGCLTGPRGEEDLRLRSAPVLLPTVVLRRTPGCAGGRAVYAEEYVAVPVGCTCVPAPGSDDPDVKERTWDPQRDPARAPGSF